MGRASLSAVVCLAGPDCAVYPHPKGARARRRLPRPALAQRAAQPTTGSPGRQRERFLSPLDVIFSDFDIVEPDLIYLSRERRSVLTEANLRGAPDLVVEILSPATRRRDLGIKRQLYERSGAREYWIVDPEAEIVEVLRHAGEDGFERVALLRQAALDSLSTPLLPGLEIRLEEVFRTEE